MLFQTAGFVRLVAIDRPTGKVEFKGLGKDMEHVNRLAVVAFRLFGGFAIDGGKDSRRQFAADASGEEVLSESAAVCRLQSAVSFCPSADGGEVILSGEKTESNDGEEGGKSVGLSA